MCVYVCVCVGGDSFLGHSNSTLRSLAECSTHVFILSSSVNASSPASLGTQFLPITYWSVQSIYRQYGKHHHLLGILWRIPLSQTLPARRHALPHGWCSCRWVHLSLLGFIHLASFLQGLVSFEPRMLLLYSFTPPPGFRSPLVVLPETAQTLVATSSRGSFSFDQNCHSEICSTSCDTSISCGCSQSSRHY